jgi:hypothetical protein
LVLVIKNKSGFINNLKREIDTLSDSGLLIRDLFLRRRVTSYEYRNRHDQKLFLSSPFDKHQWSEIPQLVITMSPLEEFAALLRTHIREDDLHEVIGQLIASEERKRMFQSLPTDVSTEIWDYIIDDDGEHYSSCIDLIGYMIYFLPYNVTMRYLKDRTPIHYLLFSPNVPYVVHGNFYDALTINMKRKLMKLDRDIILCRMGGDKDDGDNMLHYAL